MELAARYALIAFTLLTAHACGEVIVPEPSGAGAGSTTGSTSSGAGGSASPDDGLCECVVASRVDPSASGSCAECLNNTGLGCGDTLSACLNEPVCSEVVQSCLLDCAVPAGADVDLACVGDCILPFAEKGLLRELFACACAGCAAECKYKEPIQCADL